MKVKNYWKGGVFSLENKNLDAAVTFDSVEQLERLELENNELKNENDQLKDENAHLTEVVRQYQKMLFGQSSEKSKYAADDQTGDQISLFNEAEAESNPKVEEPRTLVAGHSRKPKRTHEELAKDLPVVEIVHTLPEEERVCPKCGGELTPIGQVKVRDEMMYDPAKYYINRHMQESYVCDCCGKDAATDAEQPDIAVQTIVRAPAPKPVLPNSMASASLLSYVLYAKYALALPLYRLEQDFKNNGLSIPRITLANWVIRSAEMYLEPIWKALKASTLGESVIQADETRVQVLKEKGRKASQKSYMWVFCSGEFSEKPAVLYMYSPSRAGETAKAFLGEYNKYLIVDGYDGYNGLNAERCGCIAHLRRRFKDAMPEGTALYEPAKEPPWRPKSEGPLKERYESKKEIIEDLKSHPIKSVVGFFLCNELFDLERAGKDDIEERIKIRRECATVLLDVFWSWLDSVNPGKGTALGKAVNYALNERKYLVKFLENPIVPVSNNRCENSVRPFCVGRRNWLFSVTPKGAKSSAIVYSIIETAKSNNLKPYHYLNWLFETMSQADIVDDNLIASVLPWSESVPAECKLPNPSN
jgi:transposase